MYPLVGGLSATTTAATVTANNVYFSECSKVRAAAVIAEKGSCLERPASFACKHPGSCCSRGGTVRPNGQRCLSSKLATVTLATVSANVGHCVNGACVASVAIKDEARDIVNITSLPLDSVAGNGIISHFCTISPNASTVCVRCTDSMCSLLHDTGMLNMVEMLSMDGTSSPDTPLAVCEDTSVVGSCSTACGSGTQPVIVTNTCMPGEYYTVADCQTIPCDATAPHRVLLQLAVSLDGFFSTELEFLAYTVLHVRLQTAAASVANGLNSSVVIQVTSCREVDPSEHDDCVPAAVLREWLASPQNNSALSAALAYNYVVLDNFQSYTGHDAEVYNTLFACSIVLCSPECILLYHATWMFFLCASRTH